MNRVQFFLLATLILALASCNNDPVFPLEPEIQYLDIQPREVRHLQDPFTISISFTDGDGDIGGDNVDGSPLIIRDDRVLDPAYAHLPDSLFFYDNYSFDDLSSDAQNPSIKGNIFVEIPQAVNVEGRRREEFTFSVILVDRAGNKSNEITTDPLVVFR
ncbi:MAG: hypothetical protein AAGI38_16755 [Bacteroidota bacterium]